MRGLRLLALSLAGALTVNAVTLAAAPKSKPAHKTPAAASGDTSKALNDALLAFQHDVVSVLAPQVSPGPLLAAALLARPLQNQPKNSTFEALIDRAAAADDAGPEVSWVRLAECNAQPTDCPNAAALAKLIQQAPDNAAVWLFKLGLDDHAGKSDAVAEDLAKAADAKLYDDYTGAVLRDLASNVSILPPPDNTIQKLSATGATGVQLEMVFGTASTLPQPRLPSTATYCQNHADDETIKAQCLKLGKILEWGSSPLARSLGLHLRETLHPDASQQDSAKDARRSLIWQVQSFGKLQVSARGDKPLAQHLLALARNGGTEMSMMLAAMRDYSVPTDPAVDWQPQVGN